MSHDDKHEHEPRWDVIEKLSNKIDEDIDEAFRVNRMSFIEVDIALLMLREKLGQLKMELYNMYMKTEDTKEEKPTPSKDEKAPDGMFR